MSDTLDSDKPNKGPQTRKARPNTAPARGKENRAGPAEQDWGEVSTLLSCLHREFRCIKEGGGVRFADFISFFLKYPMKRK